jgi:hypothetical protein
MESDEQPDGQSYQLDLTPVEDDVSPVVIKKESPKLRMPSYQSFFPDVPYCLVKFKMYRAGKFTVP